MNNAVKNMIFSALIAATCTGTVRSAETSAKAPAAPHQSPAQMVDALHSAFGQHHARAVHAKGILLEGVFVPSPEARSLTKAAIFSIPTVPVTVRFSDFTGIPNIPDTVGDANPRGFAVKFQPASGSGMDIVGHSFNGFPTVDADEFAVLLRAIGSSGPGAAKPTDLDKFLASHPVAKTFLTTQKPAPVSYSTLAYFGVNAFTFTNAQGKSVHVRYRFLPRGGEQFLSPASLKSKGPNYLSEEIGKRVASGPITFDWFAQIAEAGDSAVNPSVAWPESRKLVKLGSIRIDRLVADESRTDKMTLFIPGNVPPGIEPADPMIGVRSAAYPISFGERQ
jgi:catalase